MAWDKKKRVPEEITARLREDPWRDYPPARVGDRARFLPDSLDLVVVAVGPEGVTTRVAGPADAPELGEERTVSGADWLGMLGEGSVAALPGPPRAGEVWTNRGWGLWFVVEADAERAVFAEAGGGERVVVPLGPDGQPSDGRGWVRSLGPED